MNNIRDSVSNLKITILKFMLLFLVTLSFGFLVTGNTAYATDGTGDGTSTGSGSTGVVGGPSWRKTGWMVYVVDEAGFRQSPDVVCIWTNDAPTGSIRKELKTRTEGHEPSRYYTNPEWGPPFDGNANPKGTYVKNWMLKDSDGNGNVQCEDVIYTLWGEEFFYSMQESWALILEPVYWFNLRVDGHSTSTVLLGSANTIAIVQSGYDSLNPKGDPMINRYTNGNFATCAMFQQDKTIIGLTVPSTRTGKIPNTQIMAEAYGIIAVWPNKNSIHTYNGVDSPGPSPLTPKGIANIVKSYHTVNESTGEDIDNGCFITEDVSTNIIIDDEPEFKVESWVVTDSDPTEVPGNNWNPPGSPQESGNSSGSTTVKDPGKTLFVLLKKTEQEEEEEIPEGIDYVIEQSQITKQVLLSEAQTNPDAKNIKTYEFKWNLPSLKNSCPGHRYQSGTHPVYDEDGDWIRDDPDYSTAYCGNWQITDKTITVGLKNDLYLDYPEILADSNAWRKLPAIGEQTTQTYDRGNNFGSHDKGYTNWDYKMVIHRGNDKLTLAEWKGLGLEVAEVSSTGYAVGNTPSGTRKKMDYSETFDVRLSDNSPDKSTTSAPGHGSGHGTCGSETKNANLTNALTISPLVVLIKTYSGSPDGGTTDTSCRTDKVIDMSAGSQMITGVMLPTGTTVGFYPYIEMRFDTITDKDYPAYVVGQYRRSISPNDYAEIRWTKTNNYNLTLSSRQWSTHASATSGSEWRQKDSVLPGGAVMNLGIKESDRQKVTVVTYQTILEGDGRTQAEFAGEVQGMEEADAVSYHESYVGTVTDGLEGLSVEQYVDTDWDNSDAFGGQIVEPGSNLGSIGGGGKASTEDKYYFRGDMGTAQDGDLDVRQLSYNSTKYVFSSDTSGNILMNGSVILTKNQDASALSNATAKNINNRTYIVDKLVKAIERNTGSDSGATNVSDGAWYNEAFDGITVIVQTTVLETGMIDPATRTAVLDVKLTPKNKGQSDLFSSAYISQFKMKSQTIYGEDDMIGTFSNMGGSKSVYMKEMENLYKTKPFYIPNVNVQDLR